MNIYTAKTISLTRLLETLGHSPTRINQHANEWWFLSPLRTEVTPSFKVKDDRIWFDHGLGEGGGLIEFALKYQRNHSVKEVLKWLSHYEHLANQGSPTITKKPARIKQPHLMIDDVKPLLNRSLIQYVTGERKIDLMIARHCLKEVNFTINDRSYFALAMPNRSGGWELRNSFFKGSSSPKDISTIKSPFNAQKRLSVFEGFMDYLSILTQENQRQLLSDVVILNSLALGERALALIAKQPYREIETFFDNDEAGQRATNQFGQLATNVLPQNYRYPNSKDVNQHHIDTFLQGRTR